MWKITQDYIDEGQSLGICSAGTASIEYLVNSTWKQL